MAVSPKHLEVMGLYVLWRSITEIMKKANTMLYVTTKPPSIVYVMVLLLSQRAFSRNVIITIHIGP